MMVSVRSSGRRRRWAASALIALAGMPAAACGGGEEPPSAESQAIVDRVQASYADVPAVVVETTGHLEDGTPVRGRQVLLLEDGVVGAGSSVIEGPSGGGADIVWDALGTTHFRVRGATCWTADSPYGAAGNEIFAPELEPGSRPRRERGRIVLVGTEPGGGPLWEWEIDAATDRLVSQRLAGPTEPLAAESARIRVPRRVPAIPVPTPVC